MIEKTSNEQSVEPEQEIVVEQSEEVLVFAKEAFTQADIKSLEELIFRENHLRKYFKNRIWTTFYQRIYKSTFQAHYCIGDFSENK